MAISPPEGSVSAHDVKQPLNVINLAVANLRVRLAPSLEGADADYFEEKLRRIEQQVVRAAALIDRSTLQTPRKTASGQQEQCTE